MLWNSLSSARAGLKILGALLAQCSPESLLGCLGRAQLCWPEQEQPCLGCAVQQMLSETHAGLCSPPALPTPLPCQQHQRSLGAARMAQGRCCAAAVPRQISWENPLLVLPAPGCPQGWCSMDGVTSKQHLLKQETPLSVHQPTPVCKLGCDKTN